MNESKQKFHTRDLVLCALFAALIAVCAWISIPLPAPLVPFTMQTFGVFVTLAVLGGRRGTLTVLVYLLLGSVGLPVFSGFRGGLGMLLGNTGGYLVGFLATALVMWAMEHFLGNGTWVRLASMVLGLVVCYAFGTAWYMMVYTSAEGAVSVWTVLGWCVFPFLLPDGIKIALAMAVSGRLRAFLYKKNRGEG